MPEWKESETLVLCFSFACIVCNSQFAFILYFMFFFKRYYQTWRVRAIWREQAPSLLPSTLQVMEVRDIIYKPGFVFSNIKIMLRNQPMNLISLCVNISSVLAHFSMYCLSLLLSLLYCNAFTLLFPFSRFYYTAIRKRHHSNKARPSELSL